MGRFVIAAYKPKPGRERQLLDALRKHLVVLRRERLVTSRPACIMRAGDGTLLEVFEWLSAEAVANAHGNPAVLALWTEFEAACEYVPLRQLSESQQLFPEFEPVEL